MYGHVRVCVHRQNPAYRSAITPVYFLLYSGSFKRRMQYSRAHAFAIPLLLACTTACGPRATLAPVAAAPAPATAVAPPAPPTAVKLTIARTVAERRYDVRSTSRIERDSAGRKDEQQLNTQALVTLSMQRARDGAIRGSGRVDSFVVQATGAGISAVAPIMTKSSTSTNASNNTSTNGALSSTQTPGSSPSSTGILFDAVLDAMTVRVTTRPLLANECDRAESGATSVVRGMLIRIPSDLVAGDRWQDSTVSVTCRVGMPITVRSQHEYTLDRIDGAGASQVAYLKRTTIMRMDGKLSAAWRAVDLVGTGTGKDDVRVDVTTGALLQLDSDATTTLQLTDRSRPTTPRTQKLTQRMSLHAALVAPSRR